MLKLLHSIRHDVHAALERDPAARSVVEVALTYPGFHARQVHRLAHGIHRAGFRTVARVVSNLGRAFTGIEIHPAATIGEGLFIDHGMGVVIGETTVIGDDVTLYQGVTLGGTSRLHEKRHPTLRDRVVVGAHAQLIGAIEVGEGAQVGAGSVVITNVPAHSTVVGVPGRAVAVRYPEDGTMARLPDPESELIESLQAKIGELQERVATLEKRLAKAPDLELVQSADRKRHSSDS